MNVMGQRYFTKDSWRWPPLLVKTLGTPEAPTSGSRMHSAHRTCGEVVPTLLASRLSLALSVACDLLGCPAMAAVFALRSAGNDDCSPICGCTHRRQYAHSAVPVRTRCSLQPFLHLDCPRLYFRITRSARFGTVIGADALMLAALLVNPYIMYMVIASWLRRLLAC